MTRYDNHVVKAQCSLVRPYDIYPKIALLYLHVNYKSMMNVQAQV
jgi:hypothetical protein